MLKPGIRLPLKLERKTSLEAPIYQTQFSDLSLSAEKIILDINSAQRSASTYISDASIISPLKSEKQETVAEPEDKQQLHKVNTLSSLCEGSTALSVSY